MIIFNWFSLIHHLLLMTGQYKSWVHPNHKEGWRIFKGFISRWRVVIFFLSFFEVTSVHSILTIKKKKHLWVRDQLWSLNLIKAQIVLFCDKIILCSLNELSFLINLTGIIASNFTFFLVKNCSLVSSYRNIFPEMVLML